MVRVVGCCLCLQVLIILHGCLWEVIAICAGLRWWMAAAFVCLVTWHCHVLLAVVVVGDGCLWWPLLMTEATVAR